MQVCLFVCLFFVFFFWGGGGVGGASNLLPRFFPAIMDLEIVGGLGTRGDGRAKKVQL